MNGSPRDSLYAPSTERSTPKGPKAATCKVDFGEHVVGVHEIEGRAGGDQPTPSGPHMLVENRAMNYSKRDSGTFAKEHNMI